jgi:hypothetical protein
MCVIKSNETLNILGEILLSMMKISHPSNL